MQVSERTNLMTKKEVAEYVNVSTRTIERYVSAGKIPYVRLPLGNKIRFDFKDVQRWLEKMKERR